ncbi:MAG TPA: alpha-hydroxy acid oxidase [Candidatus Acidoferrum sp.]|nr:alpha-hydroxy acid oxidase [Candidatus Acidoferrum sp.]
MTQSPYRPSSLAACHNIADLRQLAQRRLPKVMFDYIDGAAEDEVTRNRNMADFGNLQFVPRTLTDVSQVSLATRIQGIDTPLPLFFSPTGGCRLFHTDGDLAVSKVAEQRGMIYSLSSMATYDIETVARHSKATKWFQIYVWKDRGVVKEFIARCKAAGYHALILTVDVQTSGQRERDLRNGFTLPPKFTVSSLFDMALHPRWWWSVLTTPTITLANVVGKGALGVNNATAMGQYAASQLDPSVTYDDLAWMIEQWGGPFLVKGLVSAEDARRVVDIGATGVMLSNHGGRQLDHSISPITALPAVVDAIGGKADIIVDGGVRRGTDIIKALCLGATACSIGRAYLYGLGAGGQPGVDRAITLLQAELKRAMMLLGCNDVKKLGRQYLRS